MLQERVLDGSSPTFRLRVPGYTQAGDEIGGGGGGGGGLSNEILEAYMGAAALNDSVGKVTLTLIPSDGVSPTDIKPQVGDVIFIQDVGNSRGQIALEFVAQAGDPTTLPPGTPTRPIALASGPTVFTRDLLANQIAACINGSDMFYGEPTLALSAQQIGNTVEITFTGGGGASGGARAYDNTMDVSFSFFFAGTDPITGQQFVTMRLSHDNLKDTTFDARLAKVDKGDGCIVVPLNHVAEGTWSAAYPVHPLGIEVTGAVLSVGPGSYSVTGEELGGKYISLDVKWDDGTESGVSLIADQMGYVGSVVPSYMGATGYPLAINAVGWPLDTTINYPMPLRNAPPTTFQSPTLDDYGRYSPLYVFVTSNDGGSTAPVDGASKLMIFFRVLN